MQSKLAALLSMLLVLGLTLPGRTRVVRTDITFAP
jgi:hypothetical protein